jgi:hypothetical protein
MNHAVKVAIIAVVVLLCIGVAAKFASGAGIEKIDKWDELPQELKSMVDADKAFLDGKGNICLPSAFDPSKAACFELCKDLVRTKLTQF